MKSWRMSAGAASWPWRGLEMVVGAWELQNVGVAAYALLRFGTIFRLL